MTADCGTLFRLTLQAEAVELAGDVGDEALGASSKAELGDEVTDHAVEGLLVGFHGLRAQHVLPQEAPDGLPLLPLAGNKTGKERNEVTDLRAKMVLKWCCFIPQINVLIWWDNAQSNDIKVRLQIWL